MENVNPHSMLLINSEDLIMNNNERRNGIEKRIDPIDDYLECVTFCSVSNKAEENDCQTICMERHLKKTYF